MQPRVALFRSWLSNPKLVTSSQKSTQRLHQIAARTRWSSTSSYSRPTPSFLSSQSGRSIPIRRTYASERTKKWLRHEAKLFIRYAIISIVGGFAGFTIYFFVNEEMLERDFPTPHEWPWKSRKLLRDAHKWSDGIHQPFIDWVKAYQLARNVCLAFEDVNLQGGQIPRLSDREDPGAEVPWEFIPHDISGMSEEWRRGYFEAIMLTAKAAEHVDGYLRDRTRKVACAPEFVIGPSNPRPKPLPRGVTKAPREEDCEIAFPQADRYYMKILATKGLDSKQKIEAALEYANFIELKQRPGGADPLYNLALAEATKGMDTSQVPYSPKTLVLKDSAIPTLNVLDVLTAVANYKARNGNVASALPMYVSLLKARRSLSNEPPRGYLRPQKKQTSTLGKIIAFFSEPDYPPPPPDGDLPPWRSPEELCHEASLNIYIGEILYATSSRDDGLAWTREGVDVAEEQLRILPQNKSLKSMEGAKQTCRECLKTGLDNWTVMVAKLAKEEQMQRDSKPSSSVLSFWSSSKVPEGAEGRWDAESSVVKERVRRTSGLVENVTPKDEGIMGLFRA